MSPARKRRRRRDVRPFINDETRAVFCGPVSLDVDHARRWGWTERAIARAFEMLCQISARRTRAAQRRYPGRWKWEADTKGWAFVGPPPLGKPPAARRRGKS